MAALQTTSVTLPVEVSTAILKEAHHTSAIASLVPADRTGMFGDKYNVFTGKARGHIVAEGEKKKPYEQTITPTEGTLFTVQTTTRVSKQLQWADEDNQMEILNAIQADQSAATGETLDYAVFHAVDPLTGGSVSSMAAKALATTAQQSTATADALSDIDGMIAKLLNYSINGFALSPAFANTLRTMRSTDRATKLFPEIPMSLANVGSIEGIPAAVSSTVNGQYATTETKVLAFLGEFDGNVRWRLAHPMTAEIIPYGNPDGLGDLAEMNQIAYRTEAVFSYTVLDPKRIAVLKSAGE